MRGRQDRAADGVRTLFGEEGGDRRRGDDPRGRHGAGRYRGRGPRNYRRSDERIREDVSDRLADNEWLDASDVDVNVVAGEVILTGTVDSRYAKRLAEEICESASGVSNVQNNLRVRAPQAADFDATAAAGAPGAAGGTALPPAPEITGGLTTNDRAPARADDTGAADTPPGARASGATGRS